MGKYSSYWLNALLKLFILGIFLSGFFTRCANIGGSPQGGPRDTLPPRVIAVTPPFNSTNLEPGRIVIEFDEYVQLKDLQKEFFTSPFMNVRPTVMVKNRSIQIDIKADLDSATTYVLNLGSSVVDNNEGNPYHGLKYTFSTGDYIDSMYMSGYVSDAHTADTVGGSFIFFFDAAADSMAYDSALFLSQALAVGKTMPNGVFIHSNLKPVDYRVYAMMDNNGNQMYDPGIDDVAFLDTIFNPADLPAFLMWYDSLLMYSVAEPQIFLRTFRENPARRQNLSSFTRPMSQQLVLKFTSPFPVIDEFTLDGIGEDRIVIENTSELKDSIVYWIDIPSEQLPDTILGSLTYQRHDSVGVLYPHTQDLRFTYRRPAEPQEKGNRKGAGNKERMDKPGRESQDVEPEENQETVPGEEPNEAPDSLVSPSELKYTIRADNPLIPDNDVFIDFDYPVTEFDVSRITLTETDLKNEEKTIPFDLTPDSVFIRSYLLTADWQDAHRYRLLIPSGSIWTLDGEVNDTISREFTVADQEKMSALIVNLIHTDSAYKYIIEVLGEKGNNVLKTIKNLSGGPHTIKYVTPGTIRLRLTEDRNGNGKWDTGDLVHRIQPEKVEIFYNPANRSPFIATKANWEIEFDIDVAELFKPRQHVSSYVPTEGEDLVDLDSLRMDLLPETNDSVTFPTVPANAVRSGEIRETIEIVDLKEEKVLRKEEKARRKQEKKVARAARKRGEDNDQDHDHDHDDHHHDDYNPVRNYEGDEEPVRSGPPYPGGNPGAVTIEGVPANDDLHSIDITDDE